MSRSGYSEDLDSSYLNLYRGQVNRALRGKRGQAFLRELLVALDALPTKELIAGKLIDQQGNCCAVGAVCKARSIDVSKVCYDDPASVGRAVDIAKSMAAEIEFINDDDFAYSEETPAARWVRVRKWVTENINP